MRIPSINRFTALIVFAALFVSADAFAQLTKLNVGYVGVTSDNAAAFIARDTGIYARNGLEVQLIYMNSGSTAVAALISGDTPITQTAGPGVINATMNGADAVMIAGGNVTLDYWMLSRPEIKTAEQLRGGAVAISRFGSASDFIVRYALQRLGLTPVKDVAILQVGSLTERLVSQIRCQTFNYLILLCSRDCVLQFFNLCAVHLTNSRRLFGDRDPDRSFALRLSVRDSK